MVVVVVEVEVVWECVNYIVRFGCGDYCCFCCGMVVVVFEVGVVKKVVVMWCLC